MFLFKQAGECERFRIKIFLSKIQLIDSLLSDQDSVIEELGHLNDSIELLIDKLAEERKAEGEQEEDSENAKIVGSTGSEIAASPKSRAA